MTSQSIVSVLVLILALGLSCHESTKTFPGAPGTILCFGEGNYIFNAHSGEYYRFDFPNKHYSPVIFCVDDTDSLILGSLYTGIMDPNVFPAPGGIPLYKYSPPDTCGRLIRAMSDSSGILKSVDYLLESGKYLYCGRWGNEAGLFVFDSTFKRISDLTAFTLGKHGKYIDYAYWLDSVTIAVRVYPGVGVSLNTQTGLRRRFGGGGRVAAISRDRTRIVLIEGRQGDINQRFEVHNLNTGTVDKVDIGRDHVGSSVTLSPDCRFLAYTKLDGFLEMNMRLHIFDLIDGTDYETDLVTVRHRGLSLLWIDETFPLPDSLQARVSSPLTGGSGE